MVRSFIMTTYYLIFISSSLLSAQANDTIDNISLNGKWAILFDQENRGGVEKWHLKRVFEKQKEVSDIQVPSHWETIKKDFEGVVFYKKSFRVPESWNEGVFLVFILKLSIIKPKFGSMTKPLVLMKAALLLFHFKSMKF